MTTIKNNKLSDFFNNHLRSFVPVWCYDGFGSDFVGKDLISKATILYLRLLCVDDWRKRKELLDSGATTKSKAWVDDAWKVI